VLECAKHAPQKVQENSVVVVSRSKKKGERRTGNHLQIFKIESTGVIAAAICSCVTFQDDDLGKKDWGRPIVFKDRSKEVMTI